MASQQLIAPAQRAVMELTKDASRVRLALWLAEELTGGDIVRLAAGATVAVEGADALSATYGQGNWLSGVASGALYAFRALRIPRQRVMVTELSGRLRAGDMEAVANAAAIGIAKLAGKGLPALPTEGWTIAANAVDQVHASGPPGGGERGGGPAAADRAMARVPAKEGNGGASKRAVAADQAAAAVEHEE